jgi:hypothetical protein
MSKNKSKRKMGECTCDNCGVKFEKPLTELTRNKKLGRKNIAMICSISKINYQFHAFLYILNICLN